MINNVFILKFLFILTLIILLNYHVGFTQRNFFEETKSSYNCECFTYNSKGNKGKKIDYKVFFNYSDSVTNINNKNYYRFQTNILFGIETSYLRYADNKIFIYSTWQNAYLEDKIISESILFDFTAKAGQKWMMSDSSIFNSYEISFIKKEFNKQISDTTYTYTLKNNQYQLSHSHYPVEFDISKKYGFVKIKFDKDFEKRFYCVAKFKKKKNKYTIWLAYAA